MPDVAATEMPSIFWVRIAQPLRRKLTARYQPQNRCWKTNRRQPSQRRRRRQNSLGMQHVVPAGTLLVERILAWGCQRRVQLPGQAAGVEGQAAEPSNGRDEGPWCSQGWEVVALHDALHYAQRHCPSGPGAALVPQPESWTVIRAAGCVGTPGRN